MVSVGPLKIEELTEDEDGVRRFSVNTLTNSGREVALHIELDTDERDNGDVNFVLTAQSGDTVSSLAHGTCTTSCLLMIMYMYVITKLI